MVATGTPEDVAAIAGSYTGRYLADLVEPRVKRTRRRRREPVAA